jgi:hypothetical protein
MSDKSPGDRALQLVNKVVDLGIEGRAPGLKPSIEVATDYRQDSRFGSDEARINSLVRWHVALTGTTGFLTGLGGLASLPVTLPAGLGAAWVVQARMIGAIAHLRGYDLADDRVRTLAVAAIAGDATVTQTVKQLGGDLAMRSGRAAAGRVSGKTLIEINRKVGFRLITKAGEKGVINLSKAVPVLGGLVGGTVDGAATRTVGGVAKRAFPATH